MVAYFWHQIPHDLKVFAQREMDEKQTLVFEVDKKSTVSIFSMQKAKIFCVINKNGAFWYCVQILWPMKKINKQRHISTPTFFQKNFWDLYFWAKFRLLSNPPNLWAQSSEWWKTCPVLFPFYIQKVQFDFWIVLMPFSNARPFFGSI